jgi:gas vesicle protein
MERAQQPMGPMHEPGTMGPMGAMRPEMTMRERRIAGASWISGLTIGAVLGSALALLVATRRGHAMRAWMMGRLGRGGVSSEFRQRVSRMMSSGRTSPSALTESTQRELEKLREKAVERLDDARLRAKIMQKQAELRYLQGQEKLRSEAEF